MIKDSVGASIEKITVCINDATLTTLMDNIDLNESFFEQDKETFIKDRLEIYVKGLLSFSCTKSITSPLLKLYSERLKCLFNDEIIETFINSIGRDFTLNKYLKIKLQTKEQHRDGIYDITNDKETKNSILFEFDIAKYKEYTNNANGIEYILPLIKMLLFVDINKTFSEVIVQGMPSMIAFMDELSSKVDNSIITSFKLADTLTSSGLLFEDYFYELTQLEMDSFNKIKKINYRKQKVTFRLDSFKQYGKPKTSEEKEEEIFGRAKVQHKKGIALFEHLDDREYDEAIETGAAAKHGIDDLFDWSYGRDAEDEIPPIEDYIENERTLKEKKLEKTCKIDTVIVFLKDDENKNGKGIKIDFQVQGAPNVNKLLYPVKCGIEDIENESQAKPSQETINRIANSIEEIFNNGLYSFFLNMQEGGKNFDGIKKTYFTPNTNFIKKDNIDITKKKQDGIIPKIILAILMDCGNTNLKNNILKFFETKQQNYLNNLVGKLRSKKYNYHKKEGAVYSLYKYFEGKLDAE